MPGAPPGPFGLLGAWDGNWYRRIAEHGYLFHAGGLTNASFFPLFPIVVAGLHRFAIPLLAAELLLNATSFLVGLFALYELGRNWLPEIDARRAALLASVFPVSVVFSMAYSEGISLAAVTLAGLLAVRGRWLPCALLAGAAGLARPTGFLVALPIAGCVAAQWSGLTFSSRARGVVAALAAPAGLLSFSLYSWWRAGAALAYVHVQRAFGRSTSIGDPVGLASHLFREPLSKPGLVFDASLLLVYLACIGIALRSRVPLSWIAYGLLVLLIPVSTGTFASAGRFGLLAIPVYWGLALLARRAWLSRALIMSAPVALAVILVAMTFRYP